MDKHWWFQGASVVALAQRLHAFDPHTCRLEVRLSDDEVPKMTFRVVPTDKHVVGALVTDAAALPDINDSFLCPPICA